MYEIFIEDLFQCAGDDHDSLYTRDVNRDNDDVTQATSNGDDSSSATRSGVAHRDGEWTGI